MRCQCGFWFGLQCPQYFFIIMISKTEITQTHTTFPPGSEFLFTMVPSPPWQTSTNVIIIRVRWVKGPPKVQFTISIPILSLQKLFSNEAVLLAALSSFMLCYSLQLLVHAATMGTAIKDAAAGQKLGQVLHVGTQHCVDVFL